MRTRTEICARLLDDGVEVARYKAANFLTELGDKHVAQCMLQAADRPTAMGWIAIGTGGGQTAASTTLASEVARSALGSDQAIGDNTTTNSYLGRIIRDNEVIYTTTFAAGTGTGTITEFAILNASSAGTMLNYAAVSWPKGAGQDVVVTAVITFGNS